ncbi:protein phosphatase 2C domain-containing protein [Pseudomonas sp. CAN2814]|uniref:protein phosphatase 2C domain-containing protein n=1 Tax=Pseudomonas sp. CAN1 TaxID=3046726 RepID=UPI0026499FC3|nr:protein phosphatase 2C domain-containing protein [Pseudomonas sp. CAN1]MDN6856843.1 protein phosphatase 2C domain-containing protein [Pseudomonas sp. CAN1]
MTTISVRGAACRQGSPVNDDAIGYTAQAAWVLDGATSLGPGLVDRESDARWLAQCANGHLQRLLEAEPYLPAEELLGQLQAGIAEDFLRDAGVAATTALDLPTACLSLLRVLEDGSLELLNLCDTRIHLAWDDGHVESFGETPLEEIDRQSVQRLLALREANPDWSHAQLWQASREWVRRNRALANTPEGYWVLDPTSRWLPHVQRRVLDPSRLAAFMLVTDGFDRLLDFRRYELQTLFAELPERGVEALIDELRALESADGQALDYPRLKIHDDASVVWGEVRVGMA